MKKLLLKLVLPLSIVSTVAPTTSLISCSKSHLRLSRSDWEDQTKTALNECIANYGVDGKYYSKDNYVVFDFDNTTAIFDIQHQCTAYQIETMSYNLTKEKMYEILSADLGDISRSLSSYGYAFTFKDLIDDIVECYDCLQTKYGTFTYKGVDESKLEQLHKENDWIDFAAKLQFMYTVVSNVQTDRIRSIWSTYQFTNMTPDQVHDLEYKCLTNKQSVTSHYETWTSKTPIRNTSVLASRTFIQGVSVSENIKELYKAIKDNGIDIWVISASQIDQVRGAIDASGLNPYVSGVIALTNKIGSDGIYVPEYDTNGKGYIIKDNKWVMMDKSNPYFTSGEGKSLVIKDIIAPSYNNKGPIMCFGDSTGDFNFCTEFKDTKLTVCFNRADRSVKDGGGLMSAIAMYQKSNNITLEKANANNDTLYCLQGRDDNERLFRNSNKTIVLGQTAERLFYNKDNETLLAYITNNKLTISQACQLSIKTKIQGTLDVGFLDKYDGYHSR